MFSVVKIAYVNARSSCCTHGHYHGVFTWLPKPEFILISVWATYFVHAKTKESLSQSWFPRGEGGVGMGVYAENSEPPTVLSLKTRVVRNM